jgi:hypothetical protein
MADYIVACAAAGVVSWIDLLTEHRRHPFGDRRTVRWWFPILALDVGVAAGLVIGGHSGLDISADAASAMTWTWVLVGALGPLGLRRPIARVPVAWQRFWGGKQKVGLTYGYDFIRIWLDSGLDDAITTVRRHDKKVVVHECFEMQWRPLTMAILVWEHVADLHTLEDYDRTRIAMALTAALQDPPSDEQAASAIVSVIFEWRFRSLIEDMKKAPPDETTIVRRAEQLERGAAPPWEHGDGLASDADDGGPAAE